MVSTLLDSGGCADAPADATGSSAGPSSDGALEGSDTAPATTSDESGASTSDGEDSAAEASTHAGDGSSGGGPADCPMPGPGIGAPLVECVSGAVADGSAITIVGSGFGASGPEVVVFDDFERGSVGEPIATGAGSATVGEWSGLNTGIPRYGDAYVVSGSMAFAADFTVDSEQQAFADLPDGTNEIFYSWWQYVPLGHNYPGEGSVDQLNWKVIWLLGNDAYAGGTADDDLLLAFLGDGAAPTAVFGGNCSVYTDGSIWPEIQTTKGEWKRLWVWDRGRTDATGAVKIWELRDSGVVQHVDEANVPTLPTNCGADPREWETVSFNGYGRLTPAPASAYLDDFYVAVGPQAQARVEIGNAETYAASTKVTITTPVAWSDGSITTTVRAGAFAPGEQAYVHVFDGEGRPSATGFAVTFE
ncbi:MAG TPA: hypothetical protein VFG69_18855 [Nannocystaceae bacterium]|nr:hypothetical protein [Nannocystaceae bacterium]